MLNTDESFQVFLKQDLEELKRNFETDQRETEDAEQLDMWRGRRVQWWHGLKACFEAMVQHPLDIQQIWGKDRDFYETARFELFSFDVIAHVIQQGYLEAWGLHSRQQEQAQSVLNSLPGYLSGGAHNKTAREMYSYLTLPLFKTDLQNGIEVFLSDERAMVRLQRGQFQQLLPQAQSEPSQKRL